MTPFQYARAADASDAVRRAAAEGSKFLGGGTNLVDLMRETIERPTTLVDVTGLSRDITKTPRGGLTIGAAVRNSTLAEHPLVRARYPMLTRAIVAGASAQIRNMATVGGNLLQRTRCAYFYDDESARCNKRSLGTGCDAREGFHRNHAVLGASKSCIAVHPSDMCVAVAALDARVHIRGKQGDRSIDFADLHRLPGDQPQYDTTLAQDDLITAIELPPLPMAQNSTYRKVRDRASYAFALVSVAAALEVEAGKVKEVRLALGGVAHKPWRALKAEQVLRGKPAEPNAFMAAAAAELADAQPLRDNGFKVELAQRVIVAVLQDLAGDRS